MSAKRNKGKATETINVSEFRQWLSGVEDMQPDGWSPTAEQWKKIRAKIDALSEEASVEEPVAPAFVPQFQQDIHYATPRGYAPVEPVQPPPQRIPQSSLGDEIFIPKPSAADVVFDGGANLSSPGVSQFN